MDDKNLKVDVEIYNFINDISDDQKISKKDAVRILVNFFKKYNGSDIDIRRKADKTDAILKEIKEKAGQEVEKLKVEKLKKIDRLYKILKDIAVEEL